MLLRMIYRSKRFLQVVFLGSAFMSALALAENSQVVVPPGLREVCMRVPEKDMVRDMSIISRRPLNISTICDCADSKILSQPELRKLISMTQAEREALPRRRELALHISATYYSGVMECYASELREVLGNADLVREGLLDRPRSEVHTVFQANKRTLHSIYKQALVKHPGLTGGVVVRIGVLPSGKVNSVEIASSDSNDPEFDAEIIKAVARFDFGKKDVDTTSVTYPLWFVPSE